MGKQETDNSVLRAEKQNKMNINLREKDISFIDALLMNSIHSNALIKTCLTDNFLLLKWTLLIQYFKISW